MLDGYDKIVPEGRRIDVLERDDLVIGVEEGGGGSGGAAGDVAEDAPVRHRRPPCPLRSGAAEAERLLHGAPFPPVAGWVGRRQMRATRN